MTPFAYYRAQDAADALASAGPHTAFLACETSPRIRSSWRSFPSYRSRYWRALPRRYAMLQHWVAICCNARAARTSGAVTYPATNELQGQAAAHGTATTVLTLCLARALTALQLIRRISPSRWSRWMLGSSYAALEVIGKWLWRTFIVSQNTSPIATPSSIRASCSSPLRFRRGTDPPAM